MPLHYTISIFYIIKSLFWKISVINLDHINFYKPNSYIPSLKQLSLPVNAFHNNAKILDLQPL